MTTIEDLTEFHKRVCSNALALVSQRGKEYAPDEDTLRTFKDAAQMYGCEPSDVARMQICLKVARLKYQYKIDTTYDLINYIVYLSRLNKDEV